MLLAAVTSSAAGASEPMDYHIIQQRPQSELQQLAAWFHQDWKLLSGSADAAIRSYLGGIAGPRREQLRSELAKFLRDHQGTSDRELLESWYALGAQGWQAGLDIRRTLADVADGRY